MAGGVPDQAGGQGQQARAGPPFEAQCAADEASPGVQGVQPLLSARCCMEYGKVEVGTPIWRESEFVAGCEWSLLGAAQLLDGVENYTPGQQLMISEMFKEGDLVDVAGTSTGKGFQGAGHQIPVTSLPRQCSQQSTQPH